MIYKPVVSEKAFQELAKAKQWYDERSVFAGNYFLDEIQKSVSDLIKSPGRYRLVTNDVRRYNLKIFPYTIFYQISNEFIVIIRIRHWRQKRLKRY